MKTVFGAMEVLSGIVTSLMNSNWLTVIGVDVVTGGAQVPVDGKLIRTIVMVGAGVFVGKLVTVMVAAGVERSALNFIPAIISIMLLEIMIIAIGNTTFLRING